MGLTVAEKPVFNSVMGRNRSWALPSTKEPEGKTADLIRYGCNLMSVSETRRRVCGLYLQRSIFCFRQKLDSQEKRYVIYCVMV